MREKTRILRATARLEVEEGELADQLEAKIFEERHHVSAIIPNCPRQPEPRTDFALHHYIQDLL